MNASLHESKDKQGTFTTKELLQELDKVEDIRPGQKRKRSAGRVPIWGRSVSLWDLPYWPSLKLRHNLDVMHIEKNVCENLLGTLLGIPNKSKDNINARLDLSDNFATNIEWCITVEGTNLQGLKTHDSHILLQRILPAGLRGFLVDDIYEAIAELWKIFRQLCSETLNKDILVQMKTESPVTLCVDGR